MGILFLTLIFILSSGVYCDFGVLVVDNEIESKQFCVSISTSISSIGSTSNNAKRFRLVDLSPWDGCDEPANISSLDFLQNSVVVLNPENCFIASKAFRVSEMGACGILLATSNDVPVVNDLLPIDNFTVTVIADESLYEIKLMNGQHVKMFVPPDKFYWDFSYLIIWLTAFSCVFVGGIWTSAARARVEKGRTHAEAANQNDQTLDNEETGERSISTRVLFLAVAGYTVWAIFLFGYVLLNYYFFKYMMYVNIALFCVIVPISLYWCFLPFIRRIPLGRYTMRCNCCDTLEIRETIWLMFCVAITIFWCICIKKSWIWVLQNLFGMAVCVSLLGVWRVASLKNCTIILGFLFIYDIFMVFVTPLLTHDGKSVMEKLVIGGGDIGDSLLVVPSVFQCPFISTSPIAICTHGFLILGFGDVIVPGILIAYCHDFSTKNKIPNVYFASSLIGYGFGLLLTGVFINVMKMIQPALLYLVPCSILPVFIVACIRKEFRCMWYNHPVGYKLFRNSGESEYEDTSFNHKS
ncbi:Signal peptide peptidase-like 2B [Chamberlinius hualienensis]